MAIPLMTDSSPSQDLEQKIPTSEPSDKYPDALDKYFPPIESPLQPLDERVVVQLRRPRAMLGGLIMQASDVNAEMYNQCVAKLVAAGDTAKRYLEDNGVSIGDYVRVPLFGGDRIEVDSPAEYAFVYKNAALNAHTQKEFQSPIILATIRATEVLSKITVDPRSIKTFLPTNLKM